jgi:hypothetical protein
MLEEEVELSEVPFDYPICLNRQCPKASTCLRQLVEQRLGDDIEYWVIVSPKRTVTAKDNCPYYRCCTKVRYAKGLKNILSNLTRKQMSAVVADLTVRFSRRTYYRIRTGERRLSPSEQEEILDILKSCGVTAIDDFDAYYEDFLW